MSNKGVIVERVLDGDVPDGKNLVTKEGFKIQNLQNWDSSSSSENKKYFYFSAKKKTQFCEKSEKIC